MPLNRVDDFRSDTAGNANDRRQKLIELLGGAWVREDIQEIERVVSGSQEGWAIQRHNPGDPWRKL
jgi:hypothetical protein